MRRAALYCTLGVKCGLVYFHFPDLFSRLNSNCTTISHKRNFEIILKSYILQILALFLKSVTFGRFFAFISLCTYSIFFETSIQ